MDTYPQAQTKSVEIVNILMKKVLSILSGLLICTATLAEDRVDLEGTSIIGNRELPKILYIAPWKKPHMSELGRPVNSLINEVLSPLERDVMKRTIRYHDQLSEKQSEQQKQAKSK